MFSSAVLPDDSNPRPEDQCRATAPVNNDNYNDNDNDNGNNNHGNHNDKDATKASNPPPSKPPFLRLLHQTVSDPQTDHLIHWLPGGTHFFLSDKKRFASEILSTAEFGRAKFASFVRRLKRWGFARVPSGPLMGAYFHPGFTAGGVAGGVWKCKNGGGGGGVGVDSRRGVLGEAGHVNVVAGGGGLGSVGVMPGNHSSSVPNASSAAMSMPMPMPMSMSMSMMMQPPFDGTGAASAIQNGNFCSSLNGFHNLTSNNLLSNNLMINNLMANGNNQGFHSDSFHASSMDQSLRRRLLQASNGNNDYLYSANYNSSFFPSTMGDSSNYSSSSYERQSNHPQGHVRDCHPPDQNPNEYAPRSARPVAYADVAHGVNY